MYDFIGIELYLVVASVNICKLILVLLSEFKIKKHSELCSKQSCMLKE